MEKPPRRVSRPSGEGVRRPRIAQATGEIEFDNTPDPDELPLTFDPFGEIDIVRDATGQHILSQSVGCTIP